MKKYKGYGIVWDKAKDQALCEFKNGELLTDDKKVIKVLDELGYPGEEVTAEAAPQE